MNKYKRALINLANVAFIYADDNENEDNLIIQSLYRHLYSLGIIKYKDGKFIYEKKEN